MNIFQPQIVRVNLEKPILPKKLVTSTPIFPSRRRTFAPFKRRRLNTRAKAAETKIKDPISKFVECLSQPSVINKLFGICPDSAKLSPLEKRCSKPICNFALKSTLDTMLPSMPSLGTPIKKCTQNEVSPNVITYTGNNENSALTSSTSTGNTRTDIRKNTLPEISTISSSSFQQANISTEVEFCRPTNDCQTITSTSNMESSGSLDFSTIQEITSTDVTQDKKVNECNSTTLEKVRK